MTLDPGDVVIDDSATVDSRGRTDATDVGDAVEISGGDMAAAADGDTFAGIATTSGLALDGIVVANVHTDDPDGAVVEGASLSLSPTAGELYRDYSLDADSNPVYDQPGPVTALSDEGGTWQGRDVPAGYAVVRIDFHH